MKHWERYWFGPVTAARPYALFFSFLALLAFDCWADMAEHGGRYGVGEFNVAHFALLDALGPVPTPAIYVGTVTFAGLVAAAIVVGGMWRWATLLLALAYAYGWTMSMLDSYQHHYLLSIVLGGFVFFPDLSAASVFRTVDGPVAPEKKAERKKLRKARVRHRITLAATSAWAYALVCVAAGIVYLYTGISKTERDWRMGEALQRIVHDAAARNHGPMQKFVDFADGLGVSEETFWPIVGHGMVLFQWLVAIAYFLAPLRDRGRRWMTWVGWGGWVAAMNFHVGAEHLGLEIGWFSYYMMIMASVVFLPAKVLEVVLLVVTYPAVAITAKWGGRVKADAMVLPVAIGGAAVLAFLGRQIDLPGVFEACVVVGALGLALAVAGFFRTTLSTRALRYAAGVVAATLALAAGIFGSDARYEYWRFVGGDARRSGDVPTAIDAYERALADAPGEDEVRRTRAKLERLRAQAGGGGADTGGDE